MSKHTNVRVSDELYEKLAMISELSGMTVSQVIRWLLGRNVDKGLKHFKKLDFGL